MTDTVIPIPAIVTVPVQNSERLFPVRRICCVGPLVPGDSILGTIDGLPALKINITQ
jgi:hypothetical protein